MRKPKNQGTTYFRGGILRLSAGLMPLSNAFRECIMKCLVGDCEETLYIKSPATKKKKREKRKKKN